MKRILERILLLGLLTAMLSACGNQGTSNTSAGQSSESTLSQIETDAKTETSAPVDDGQEWELAEVIYFDAADVQTSRMTYRYNDHGAMCRYETYDENDILKDTTTWEYSYLPDGRVSSIHICIGGGTGINSIYTEDYSWDESGRIAYIDKTWDDGSTGDPEMKAYDEQGQLIEEADGTYQWYITYTETEKREKRYWISGDITDLTVRRYNKNEKIEEIRVYEAAGFTDCTEDDLTEYTIYDFDEYGRRTGYTEYSADGTVTRSSTYTYETDGHSYLAVRCDAEGNKTGSARYVYKPISEVTEGCEKGSYIY